MNPLIIWPATTAPPRRRDWRDTLRLATDLALLGIVLTLAALPLLTAGAAIATGSFAVRHFLEYDQWPSLPTLARTFRRRLGPGLLAGPAVLAVAGLVFLDVRGLHRGLVPGGVPMTVVVLAVAALLTGVLAVVAVKGRAALALCWSRPVIPVAAAGVLIVAIVLAFFIHPALTPVLAGYALFAVHVVVERLTTPG
jgi:hypothetical protein